MTQADWVKELIKIFNEDKTLCALDYDCPVCDKKYKRIFKIVEKQITLAQQRTEKKCQKKKCQKEIIKKIERWIDDQHKNDKPWDGGTYMRLVNEWSLRDYLSDLLGDNK